MPGTCIYDGPERNQGSRNSQAKMDEAGVCLLTDLFLASPQTSYADAVVEFNKTQPGSRKIAISTGYYAINRLSWPHIADQKRFND